MAEITLISVVLPVLDSLILVQASLKGKCPTPLSPDVAGLVHAGNVARFMNHRCDGGNAFARGILIEGNSALLYKVAFFALHDIEPLEELTYNYNWEADENPDGNDPGNRVCKCGSVNCLGVFKF